MMITIVSIEITHKKPIPNLADLIAGRAYTIQNVVDANVIGDQPQDVLELQRAGFTAEEIALGATEVHRT
jgi:hypothetical protein